MQVIYITGRSDYRSGPYTVVFPAGVTQVSFPIQIVNDRTLERNEKFVLTISQTSLSSGFAVGHPFQATMTIVDDDGK